MELLLASNTKQNIDKIVEKLIALTDEKSIGCIITASQAQDDKSWLYPNNIKVFEDRGYQVDQFDIADKPESDVRAFFDQYKIIFFSGGNTFYLLEKMKKCNLKSVLDDFFARDGVYVGSSAGSIVMGPDIEFVAKMDEPHKASLENFEGMNYVPFLIVPHHKNKEHQGGVQSVLDNPHNADKALMCLEDNQMLYVSNNCVEVL